MSNVRNPTLGTQDYNMSSVRNPTLGTQDYNINVGFQKEPRITTSSDFL